MPLPDERPRASVANLIGRFEQHHKRNSIDGASPPPPLFNRSFSVTSHTTGDSAKAEAKDKREWPPKISNALSTPPPSSWSKASQPVVEKPVSPVPVEKEPAKAITPPPTPPTKAQPKPVIDTPTLKVPEGPKSRSLTASPTSLSDTGKAPKAKPKPTQTKQTTPSNAKPIITKTPPSKPEPTKTPAKPEPTKATPKAQTPLKPQHTGTSTAARKTPVPRPTASTPARAKTPLAKSTPPTAKTPTPGKSSAPPSKGSGLFAHTAASLAKAHNAPPPPTPVKKVTLSKESAERLFKQTAASASKIRTPTTPAQTVKKAPVKAATPAKNPAKPKAGQPTEKAMNGVKVKPKDAPDAAESSTAPANDTAPETQLDEGLVGEPEEHVEEIVPDAEAQEQAPAPENDIEQLVNLLEAPGITTITATADESVEEIPDEY